VKKLLEATQKAKQDTARYMTAQLRKQAVHSGWDPEVASTLHVAHEGGKFTAKVHPDYADRAFVHEYGDENVKPTAAIRKFMNDPKHTNDAFMVTLNNRWKETK
jgi:glucose/arabinose dehydrogenase